MTLARITRHRRTRLWTGVFIILALLFTSSVSLFNQQTAHATLEGFSAGNIIDDLVMSKKDSMTQAEIQSFLKSKNPCNNTNLSWLDSKTATLGKWTDSRGYIYYYNLKDGHFVCMADDLFNGESAAHIIWQAAQDYNINPQVLIVLLEKEQGLVRDTFPNNHQYAAATGYDCPDSGSGCSSANAGFKTQIRKAAALFHDVLTGGWSRYPVGTNYIQYNPSTSCGGSNVDLKNRATSALYRYTPYQPNQAALNAGWGTAYCGAYGNRNFYNFFTSWFGSTRAKTFQISRSLYFSPGSGQPIAGEKTAVSFIIKNIGDQTLTLDSIGVAVRDKSNNNFDYPFVNITLKPGETYQYYQYRTFGTPGDYHMQIYAMTPYGTWTTSWPQSASSSIVRTADVTVLPAPNLSLSRSLYYSPSTNPANASTEDITASSFVIKNNETFPVTVPELAVSAQNTTTSERYDFPSIANVTIQPGKEYEYYTSRNFDKSGSYKLSVQVKTPGGTWESDWPNSTSTTIEREKTVDIVDPPKVSVVRDLWVSPVLAGQPVGASFVVKNDSTTPVSFKELAVRGKDSAGNIKDYPSVTDITLEPGQTYTYYQYQTFNSIDTYSFWISAKVYTNRWTDTWPSSNSTITRKVSMKSSLPNVVISRNVWHSPSKAFVNQTKGASFVITNKEDRQITIPAISLGVRDSKNTLVSFPYVKSLTLNAGQSYEYYQYRSFASTGSYRFFIATQLPSGQWSYDWPASSKSTIIRSGTFGIQ